MPIGIDLTYIPRFKDKEDLARKILSEDELKSYYNSISKEVFLASRFALKEALIKFLELNILSVDLKDINIKKKENGAVYVLYKNKKYSASLSHEKDYCVGVVTDD